jgi:hypothetical protein
MLERQGEWEARRQAKLEDLRLSEEASELAELRFTPEISARALLSPGKLPKDIRDALHSPVPASSGGSSRAAADPESIAVRQTNELNAFLHRQAKAREERARRDAARERPGTSRAISSNLTVAGGAAPGAAPSPSPAHKRPTIPVEPALRVAQRAARGDGGGGGSVSPRAAAHPYAASYPGVAGPVLVPISTIPDDGSTLLYSGPYAAPAPMAAAGGPAAAPPPSAYEEHQQYQYQYPPQQQQQQQQSVPPAHPAPLWTTYAPEVAALLSAGGRGGAGGNFGSGPGAASAASGDSLGRASRLVDEPHSAPSQMHPDPEELVNSLSVRELYGGGGGGWRGQVM